MLYAANFSEDGAYVVAGGSGSNEARVFETQSGRVGFSVFVQRVWSNNYSCSPSKGAGYRLLENSGVRSGVRPEFAVAGNWWQQPRYCGAPRHLNRLFLLAKWSGCCRGRKCILRDNNNNEINKNNHPPLFCSLQTTSPSKQPSPSSHHPPNAHKLVILTAHSPHRCTNGVHETRRHFSLSVKPIKRGEGRRELVYICVCE